MSANAEIIQIEELESGYGKKVILHGVSLKIRRGEVGALIGRNGVGKTTLLKTVMGFLKTKKGQIFFEGNEISRVKPNILVEMGISYVPQGKPIFPHMTVQEHLDIGAWTLKEPAKKESMLGRVYSLFPKLQERKYQKAGTLSGGERQMVSIARAMMSSPRVMLLDEPSFGLSPIMVNVVFAGIGQINRENVTILLIEQNGKKALEHSDSGYVMDMGRITLAGRSKELLQNEELKTSFFCGERKDR